MLGALEVKAVARKVRQLGDAWKPLHAAVLSCLYAHRNRRGLAWPPQSLTADFTNVDKKTVARATDDLIAWGLIARKQPRALSSGEFQNTQYTFLFPVADEERVENPADGSVCPISPEDNFASAGGQKPGSPEDKNRDAIRNLSSEDPSTEDPRGKSAEKTASETPAPALEDAVENSKLKQAATRLMEMVGVPITDGNRTAVEAGITAEAVFSGRSIEETAEAIAHAALDDQRRGVAINKFYFEDAKWRQDGGNGNGRKLTQAERALDACERAKANIRRRYASGSATPVDR